MHSGLGFLLGQGCGWKATRKEHVFLSDLANHTIALTFRMLSIGKATCNSDIKVYITKQYRMFLFNSGNSEIKFEASELFGFNVGSWQEKLSGAVNF